MLAYKTFCNLQAQLAQAEQDAEQQANRLQEVGNNIATVLTEVQKLDKRHGDLRYRGNFPLGRLAHLECSTMNYSKTDPAVLSFNVEVAASALRQCGTGPTC